MTTNYNINSFFESYVQSQVVKSTERDKAKEQKMELELASLLQDLTKVLSEAGSATGAASGATPSATGTKSLQDGNNPPVPSEQQIEQALQAVAALIAQVKTQINQSSNQDYIDSLKIQVAQLTEVENALNALLQVLQQYENNPESFQNWLQQNMPQFEQDWNYEVRVFHQGDWTWEYPDREEVIDQVVNWVAQNLHININISINSAPSLYSILQSALQQIQSFVQPKIDAAAQQLFNTLTAINNPVVQAILSLLKGGNSITAQQMQSLAAILSQVMQMLLQIANAETENGSGAPSNTVVIEMLSMMAGMMNELQGEITKAAGDKAGSDVSVAQALIKQAQDALNKAIQAEEQIQQQEAAQKALNIFMKVIEAVVAVIISTVACAFGQFQIAAMVMVMMILQESGAMDKLTSAIAGAMVKDGWMNQTQAKIVADVIVAFMTIVVTLGAGMMTGVSGAAPTVVEDAAQAAGQAAAPAAEAADLTAQQAARAAMSWGEWLCNDLSRGLKTALDEVKQLVDKINIFQRISPLANLMITSASQSVMETNLISDATVASLTAEKKDQSEIEKGQMIASIIGSIVMTLVSAGSMSGMTSGITAGTGASRVNWTKMMQNFSTFLRQNISANVLTGLYYSAQFGGTAIEAGAQAGLGVTYVKQAEAQREIGLEEGLANFFQELAKTTDNGLAATEKSVGNILKADEKIGSTTLQTMLAYEATFAQLFAQAV